MPLEPKELMNFMFEKLQREAQRMDAGNLRAQLRSYHPGRRHRGIEEITSCFERYALEFPDSRFQVNSVVAEGDWVAAHYTFTATHTLKLAGLPTTTLRVPCMVFSRIHKNRILEQFFVWDNLGPRRQIWLASIARQNMHRGDPEITGSPLSRF
jgi:predicted ester cyclase